MKGCKRFQKKKGDTHLSDALVHADMVIVWNGVQLPDGQLEHLSFPLLGEDRGVDEGELFAGSVELLLDLLKDPLDGLVVHLGGLEFDREHPPNTYGSIRRGIPSSCSPSPSPTLDSHSHSHTPFHVQFGNYIVRSPPQFHPSNALL